MIMNLDKDTRVFRRGRPSRVKAIRESCFLCKKATSSVLFVCHCKQLFCGAHLLPEIHECVCMNAIRQAARQRNAENLMGCKVSSAKVLVI